MSDIQLTKGSRYLVLDDWTNLGRPLDGGLTGWEGRILRRGEVITFKELRRVEAPEPGVKAMFVADDGFKGAFSRASASGGISDTVLKPAGEAKGLSLPKPIRFRGPGGEVMFLGWPVLTLGPPASVRPRKKGPTKR